MTGEQKRNSFRNSDIVIKSDFLRKLNLNDDSEIVFKTFSFGKTVGKEFIVCIKASDAACLVGSDDVSFREKSMTEKSMTEKSMTEKSMTEKSKFF